MKINEIIVEAIGEMYSWIDPEGEGYNTTSGDHGHMIYSLAQQGKFHDDTKNTHDMPKNVKVGSAKRPGGKYAAPAARGIEDGSDNHLKFLINAAIEQGWIQVQANNTESHIQMNSNASPAAKDYLFRILTKFKSSNVMLHVPNKQTQTFDRYDKAIQFLKGMQ